MYQRILTSINPETYLYPNISHLLSSFSEGLSPLAPLNCCVVKADGTFPKSRRIYYAYPQYQRYMSSINEKRAVYFPETHLYRNISHLSARFSGGLSPLADSFCCVVWADGTFLYYRRVYYGYPQY